MPQLNRVALLVSLLSAFDSVSAQTQRANTADVWLACRHPQASPVAAKAFVDPLQLQDAAQVAKLRAKYTVLAPLQNLCSKLVLPRGGSIQIADVLLNWNLAAKDSLALPSIVELSRYASEVDSVRRMFESDLRSITRSARPDIDLGIQFATDSFRVDMALQGENIRRLASAVRQYLNANPTDTVRITGSADIQGKSVQHNLDLAKKRAVSVAEAIKMVDNTIDGSRIVLVARPDTSSVPTAGKLPASAAQRNNTESLNALSEEALSRAIRFRMAGAALPNPIGNLEFNRDAVAAAQPSTTERKPFNASALTVALTDAIVDQARQDLQFAALSSAIPKLCGMRAPVIAGQKLSLPSDSARPLLFGNTCALTLSQLRSETIVFRPSLPAIRTAIRADLNTAVLVLLDTLIGQAQADAKMQQASSVARTGLLIGKLLQAGRDPWQEIITLPKQAGKQFQSLSQPVRRAICKSTLVLDRYLEARAVVPNVDATDETGKLPEDSILMYAARTYVLQARAQAGDALCPDTLLKATNTAVDSVLARTQRIIAAMNNIDTLEKRALSTIAGQLPIADPSLQVRAILRSTSDRYRAYATLVSAAVENVGDVNMLWLQIDSIAEPATSLIASLSVGEYRAGIGHLGRLVNRIPANATGARLDISSELQRPLALASDLSQAQSSEEATEAFRSFLGESDGFRGKRIGVPKTKHLGINAYAGAVGGATVSGKKFGEFGWFLPVGVEYGARRQFAWMPRYVGIMAYPFDLGAITALRYTKSDSADTSTKSQSSSPVKLEQAFSPGVLLAISPSKNWPVSFGINNQWRKVPPSTRLKYRLGLFVAVDVPIFP